MSSDRCSPSARALKRSGNGIEPRDSPYFGLNYYDERYGEWFFGRESERASVISNLQATRLTLLHADSGVGKSSILRAGVAWRLNRLSHESVDDRDIPIVFSSWTDDPVAGLVAVISSAIEPFIGASPPPALPTDDLGGAIEAAANAADSTLLIILDQFEEYFLYSSKESPPERFADQLAATINRVALPASFLISIREDSYAALGDLFKGRLSNVYANFLAVDYLDQDAARGAICEPLEVYNRQPGVAQMSIEPGLVDAVLEQVRVHDGTERNGTSASPPRSTAATANGGGSDDERAKGSPDGDGSSTRVETPLLQLAMESVWVAERAEGSTVLRKSTLMELGGANSIVDTHLEKQLAGLDDDERGVAIDVFDYLVTPSGGKIAESVPDLARRTIHSEERIRSVLEKLDRARIVRSVQAPPARDPVRFRRYEIFHDVLAPAIGRAVTRREEERLRSEADAEARRARHLRNLAIFACAAALLAIALLILALDFRGNAVHATHVAQSRLLATEAENGASSLGLASLQAIEAYRVSPTVDARSAILTIADSHEVGSPLTGSTGLVQIVAFSPDGRTVVSGGRDGTIRLWYVATRRETAVMSIGRTGAVYSVAFSPDGSMLASGGPDGMIRLWDASRHTPIGAFVNGRVHTIETVAFSPDGRVLATGSYDGIIRFWNVATHRQIGRAMGGLGGIVSTVAFSPDGRLVAAAGHDRKIRLYGVSSHRLIGRPLTGNRDAVLSVAFSPDGRTLASGGEDKTVRFWDLARHREIGDPLRGQINGVRSVAFSPDGRTVASSSFDGTIMLWDLATHQRLASFTGHVGAVESVAFRPDGKMLVSGGADRTVRLWTLTSPREVGEPFTAGGTPVKAVAYSPSGTLVASGGDDATIRLWDLSSQREVGPQLTGHRKAIFSLAFSPDGRLLASGSTDRMIRLWDLANHREEGAPLTGNRGGVMGVAFSPDGKVVASAGADRTVRLWSVATHRQIGAPLRGNKDIVYSVAFSPDGRTIASGSYDGTVRVWSVADGRQLGGPLTGGRSAVSSVAFAPSGRVIAAADVDGAITLWDVKSRREIGAPLAGHANSVESVAFSPDGRTLASASNDGTVWLWDVAGRRGLGRPLMGHRDAVKSVAFSPDGRTVVSGSDDGTVRRWTYYPIGFYIRQLCSYIDLRGAKKMWKASEPSIPYRRPCS